MRAKDPERFQQLVARMTAPVSVRSVGRRCSIPLAVGLQRMQRSRDRVFLASRFGSLERKRSKFTLANSPVVAAVRDRIRSRPGFGH